MKNFVLLFIFSIIVQFTQAQSLIAVQNGGAPSFYADLGDAIDNAVAGDTLYIPGKSYTLNKTIDKRIHLVGTGINPNSTLATGITSISSGNASPQIALGDNADGGSLTGIQFTVGPNYNIQVVGADVSNYFISRCIFRKTVVGNFSNSLFSQNIINNVNIYAGNTESIFTNNILTGRPHQFFNTIISNNVFLSATSSVSAGNEINTINSVIENNIWPIYFGFDNFSNSNSLLRNNISQAVLLSTVFENYSNNPNEAILFTANFQLPDASPYKNAGTDGTDIGIYGGRFPWKDGSAPFNPQIILKNILGNTDENGNIQAEISG